MEQVLTALLNELAASPDPLLLVLDDYHQVDSTAVDEALGFLLDHLPGHLHIAMTTREDPRLSLPRLRARGFLTELRAEDLRFTVDEAAAFLNEVMGLDLPADDVAALETRTEGWIAGLQLAALLMQGRDDVSGFIQRFAGDNRYIVDYLVEEVLGRQPGPVRDFLLRTSILDRLSGSLCDAVTGRDDSRKLLDQLDRENLFVVPLDDSREWYRYHHLFAEVLRVHADDDPAQAALLHRRASEWFERHDAMDEAIRHAFAAGDDARAADLIERVEARMRQARQETALLGMLRRLPDDVVRNRPVLSVTYAGVLLSNGILEGVDALLQDAQGWLDADADDPTPVGMVVVNHDAFQRMPAWISTYRAAYSMALGDTEAAAGFAQQGLELRQQDDYLVLGASSALLGLVYWRWGDLDAAYRNHSAGMEALGRAGSVADAVGGVVALADIRITQGRLTDALEICRGALRVSDEHGPPPVRGTPDMYVGLSDVSRERNDLVAARQHLATGMDLGEALGFPQFRYRWRLAMARIRQAEGDLVGALELIDEAERFYISDFYPDVRPISAYRTRLWIALGRLAEARRWADERGLSAGDDLSYLREFEHITLARILLGQYRTGRDAAAMDDAVGLLDRLQEAAEAGERFENLIEIQVIRAMAHMERGDLPAAVESLERALATGEPEGYARLFLDEGQPMAMLLSEVASTGAARDAAARLLAAFGDDVAPVVAALSPSRARSIEALVEPLSERELDVLRLIAEGRSNSEIADRLYLALSTVKGHNRAIFGKLGVQRRTEAVARATDLGLLEAKVTGDRAGTVFPRNVQHL